MLNFKQHFRVACLLMLCLLLGACQSLEKDRTYNKPGLTVSFLRLYELSEDLEDFQIDHPVTISTDQVQNHLLSLYYQDISVLDQKAYPVFTNEDVKKLTAGLKAALGKVEDGNYIYFGFQAKRGVTEGEVFSSVGKIHWRFLRINDVDYSNHFLGTTAPTWRLVRRMVGQEIYKEKTGLVKVTKENWIVVDLNLSKLKRRSATRSLKSAPPSKRQKQSTPPSDQQRIRKKLKNLKDLYENGLIDEQDYQRKKNEILNQNF